jgi:hypothetical protein
LQEIKLAKNDAPARYQVTTIFNRSANRRMLTSGVDRTPKKVSHTNFKGPWIGFFFFDLQHEKRAPALCFGAEHRGFCVGDVFSSPQREIV